LAVGCQLPVADAVKGSSVRARPDFRPWLEETLGRNVPEVSFSPSAFDLCYSASPMTQFAVVAERYARAIEAEVARTQLEAAGIDCAVHSSGGSAELRVRAEELEAARAILNPRAVRSGRATLRCAACGGRNVKGQGRYFWAALALTVAALIAAAFLFDLPTLIVLALIGTGVLAGVEITLKDWLCVRCGRRWRG
jgi:hypothetical protein